MKWDAKSMTYTAETLKDVHLFMILDGDYGKLRMPDFGVFIFQVDSLKPIEE